MKFVLPFLVVLLSLGSIASANNNFFLPGDAFFPTVIRAEDLAKLQGQDPKEAVFSYSSFGGYDGAFCGYAGYANAKLTSVDAKFIANLGKAYAHLRKHERKELVEVEERGKKELRETNGMRVLFYPKAFEFLRLKLGLQYNEKWVEETEKFGHKWPYLRLCELVNDKDAVMESWRDGSRVGTFEMVLPKVELTPEIVKAPVILNGDVQAFIVSARVPLTTYFRPEDYRTPGVIVIKSSGITCYEFHEQRWQVDTDTDLLFP